MTPRRSRRQRRNARGQALLEAAIGTTLFVTIIAFGIHFAEVGFLSLKVQEAAVSALWDGTHGEMHTIPVSYDDAEDSMRDAAANAEARYSDFKGLSSAPGAGRITQVFTQGTGMQVRCGMDVGVGWTGAIPTRLVYRDNGGTACGAQATLSTWRFPSSFLDGPSDGALYQKQNLDNSLTNLRVCAVGRAVGGTCNGRFSMLVDDWGLAGPLESATCNILMQDQLIPCTNAPMHAAVWSTYAPTTLPIPTAASNLAQATLFWNPLPPTALAMVGLGMMEKTFWMSAAGEDVVNFIQAPPLMDPISRIWPTTPGSIIGVTTFPYGAAHLERFGNGGCFLGKDCD
ncbi:MULTISPECIES: pilus assembly protein [Myxococcus]|uniref:Pilus assembly protein n=1 Tax=Myxococcus llanfairpwllgwyngyllgogerychwyrndrobwllllantysiliogogogochensis TaxID=2590453 RepID=A0A540WZ16_9BACT|nr:MULTISPECIES: pilus assembly protein [Myxococcus]NTX05496.1 pilus assembly protein [Myxococcus sp. CA040A]NTX54983.1 pilus assembly protein [Myxococcus sp. CA039A]TQF14258.1 pilus assembly protein [Myxococcus llanfairpwllgwyngyllgogerychwyrndrobwllllantysiliogogogochensis]